MQRNSSSHSRAFSGSVETALFAAAISLVVACARDTLILASPDGAAGQSGNGGVSGASMVKADGGGPTGTAGTGGAPEAGSSAGTGGAEWQHHTSGTRLQFERYVTSDGVDETVGWFDSQMGVSCSFRRAVDGQMR